MIVLKNTSKVLVVFLLTFINSRLLAQSTPEVPVTPRFLMQEIAPLSPDLATLGQYAMQQPNLSNGLVNHNIDLLNIKENGIDYPISLFYSYSGFKMKEEASSVGLGWGITEGSIIRLVKHIPDDTSPLIKKFEDFGGDLIEETGNGYVDPMNWCYPSYSQQEYSYTANRIFYKFYDAQPDVYVYSFGKYNGKFLWLNGKAIQLEHNDIVIERDYSNQSFILTTPDGLQYTFNETDRTGSPLSAPMKMTVCPTCVPWYHNPVNEYVTAWKLVEIKNKMTKSFIKFTYDYNVVQDQGNDQISAVTVVKSKIPGNFVNYNTEFRAEASLIKTFVTNSFLKEIESNNYKVFFKTKPRKDGQDHRIDEIQVYNKRNLLDTIKRIQFVHDYFGDTTSTQKCWLTLKKVRFLGGGDNNEYCFSYVGLPFPNVAGLDKAGFAIDHWNYFNGIPNQSLMELRPSILAALNGVMPSNGLNYPWANRTASFQYAKILALEKIDYPTKGYTKIDYESADGKGIRIASQEDFDGEKSTFKYYDYHVTPYVNMPVYYYDDYFAYQCCNGAPEPELYVTTFLSSPKPATGLLDDTENFYPKVTENLGTPDGRGGKTVHIFQKLNYLGNKVLETEKIDYEFGNPDFVRKEEYFYAQTALKTIPYWLIPEMNSTALPGGPCRDDWSALDRPATGPSDPLLPTGFSYLLGNFGLYRNAINSVWIKLDSTRQTVNNVSTTTKYFYHQPEIATGLPKHSNAIKVQTKASNGTLSTTEFYHAGDTDPDNGSNILGIPQMWDPNYTLYKYSSPVLKKKIYIDNILTSKEVNDYTYNSVNDCILHTGYTSFPDGTDKSKVFWELKYDDKINLVSVKRENGSFSSYFWGYNSTVPIIKAENVDYNTLSAAILTATSNIEQLLSDVGDLKTQTQKNLWKNFNLQLRNLLPDIAQVITYTQKPLVGVTSQTDVKGMTTYYEYDTFQRLKHIKDQQGNIIKSYDYHFKP